MLLDPLIGQSLGQFVLRERLGAGGMGTVYRAYQANLNRDVAVKVLPQTLSLLPDSVRRFNLEAQIAASLEHPHIVPIIDFGVQEQISYVAMRLLTGGSLKDRPLPTLSMVADLLWQLAGAMDYAHRRRVIHRDIKATNVMFDSDGVAYIVDFGIAKLMAETTHNITQSGALIGTPSHMAPELWRGEPATPASDQYALAIMLYDLLVGRVPFEADTPFAFMHKHLYETPTPPHLSQPGLPPALHDVLAKALAKEPGQRYPNVTAFAEAFTNATAGSEAEPRRRTTGSTPAITPTPTAIPPRPRRRTLAVGGIALTVVMLIAAIGFIALRGNAPGTAGDQTGSAPAGAPLAASDATGTTTPSPRPPGLTVRPVLTSAFTAALPITELAAALTPEIILSETPAMQDAVSETAMPVSSLRTETNTPPPTPTESVTPSSTSQAIIQAVSETATDAPTPEPSATPTATATHTPTPEPSATPTSTATNTPQPTPTATDTPRPTATTTVTPTATDTETPTPTFDVELAIQMTLDAIQALIVTPATATPTPDLGATVAARLTATTDQRLTETATQWTATPLPTTTDTPTPIPTATDTPTPTPTATERPLPTAVPLAYRSTNSNAAWEPLVQQIDGVLMALVPPGCLRMGENGDGGQQCFTNPFWIDVYEVANGPFGSEGQSSGATRPRDSVTWVEARDFCASRGARLPNEAEWEYAARGPDQLRYPWGNEFIPSRLLYAGNYGGDGSRLVDEGPEGRSWVGAYQMSGNLREWVSSLDRAYPYVLDERHENDADVSTPRIVRGGSWGDTHTTPFLTTYGRTSMSPTSADSRTGFRCARTFAEADRSVVDTYYQTGTEIAYGNMTSTAASWTATPTPTWTPTITLTPTVTDTPSMTPTPSITPTPTDTPQATLTPTGDPSIVNTCVHSGVVEQRLTSGMHARTTINGQGPTSLRTAPGGGTVTSMPEGLEVDVIGGPICEQAESGNWNRWWQLQTAEGTGWAPEGRFGVYYLEPFTGDGEVVSQSCEAMPPTRLTRGLQGMVTPGLPNRIRTGPDVNSPVIARIPPSEQFIVLEGPVCYGGYVWQQVLYRGIIGWTPEADASEYYVAPVNTISGIDLGVTSYTVSAVYQRFVGGRMLVLMNTSEVFAIIDESDHHGYWLAFLDQFAEGDPESDPSLAPPSGMLQPIRGFGAIWRANPAVRDGLGWAVEGEYAYSARVEYHPGGEIKNGVYVYSPGYRVIYNRDGRGFTLYEDGSWSD